MRVRKQKKVAPLIIKRDQHSVSRDDISKNALKVLYRLKNEGYEAYLVGGCVRDILLGKSPKDFDVATNATPEQIKKCFRNCRLIGRRFRLAHIYFQQEIIEVATFRASQANGEQQHVQSEHGMLLRDNVYGDIREDAWRRDFTVNALYYNIADFSIRDYVDGMHDLNARQICMIGDPATRYAEDPVRILRAIRLSVKLDLTIHPDTATPIPEYAHLLENVASGRLFEEFKKIFLSSRASDGFEKLKHEGLLKYLLPQTSSSLDKASYTTQYDFIHASLKNTDRRLEENRPVTIGYLLATLLWYPVLEEAQANQQLGMTKFTAFEKACRKVISQQTKTTSLPRFVSSTISDIWHLQLRLNQIDHPKALKVIEHPRFKAAYDFLLLRAESGENVKDIASWWTEFYVAEPHDRSKMVHGKKSQSRGDSSGRRRRRRPHQSLSSTSSANDTISTSTPESKSE